MWLILAFASAALLGFYDVFKKQALKANDVVVVLTLNTLFGSLIFLPFVLLSAGGQLSSDSLFYVPVCGWDVHQYIILKAVIVLAAWLCGYFALQNLPLTIVGHINATRPTAGSSSQSSHPRLEPSAPSSTSTCWHLWRPVEEASTTWSYRASSCSISL